MPVMKEEYSSDIRLLSPGVKQATTPATPIKRATNTSEMPIYQDMIFQFMELYSFRNTKLPPEF